MLLTVRLRYVACILGVVFLLSCFGLPAIPDEAKTYFTTPQWSPTEHLVPALTQSTVRTAPTLVSRPDLDDDSRHIGAQVEVPNSAQGISDVSRKGLWVAIHKLFQAHRPSPLEHVEWQSEWPTMPTYMMNKTYDAAEVVQKSPALSPEQSDAAIHIQASLEAGLPTWSNYGSLYSGRGYVMTTGSPFMNRVFAIGVQMLHKLDSKLPVEIWTKDQAEYDITIPVVQDLAKALNLQITCYIFADYIDVSEFPEGYTSNYLMKGLAMLLSSFEEVIMLDADNVPVQLPDALFESVEYKKTGLMLWPDFWSNSLSATLHTVLNIGWKFHRTCESGQVVVNKRKHFESLILASYYNWYGDYAYYRLITLDGMGTGDKDTFVVGALTLDRPFHFTERPLELLQASYLNGTRWKEDRSVFNGAMGQFNPLNQSEVMFMHMHSPKLNLQDQDDVTPDLVFVRADAENVNFNPGAEVVERMIWESIAWVECDSVMRKVKDPKNMCDRVKDRLRQKNIQDLPVLAVTA